MIWWEDRRGREGGVRQSKGGFYQPQSGGNRNECYGLDGARAKQTSGTNVLI